MKDEDLRRKAFDALARAYEAERPGYPEAIFDDLVRGLPDGARALEIGCGTGKATRSLVARGVSVEAVELGENLAAVAREVLAGKPFTVRVGRFEDWEPPSGAFHLAMSAQAYHWVDPEIAGPKIASALRPGAPFAAFWNVDVEPIPWLEAVYEAEASDLPDTLGTFRPLEDHVTRLRAHVEQGGALRVEEIRTHPWTMTKTADAYVRLLDTYSDHHTAPPQVRDRLYRAIRAAIDAHGGSIEIARVALVLSAKAA